MWKKALIIVGLVAFFGLGVFITRYYFTFKIEQKVEENAEVLLERVKTVAKLVTIEGYFSEIYNYKDYWGYDWAIFRKKALMRVKAKVSIGYDLSKMKMEAIEETRTLVLSNIPEAELISIEHDIDYYDLQQGAFNSFSEEDYNKLNKGAKEFIVAKVQESDLYNQAEAQGNEMIELIRFITESAGWTVVVEGKTFKPLRDTLMN
jgi:predicted SPOUT superfamily RNA methylase MTH1